MSQDTAWAGVLVLAFAWPDDESQTLRLLSALQLWYVFQRLFHVTSEFFRVSLGLKLRLCDWVGLECALTIFPQILEFEPESLFQRIAT